MKLVIVESPNKIKKISKILGPEYAVKSTVGHFRNVKDPKKSKHYLGINMDKWMPDWEVDAGKKKTLKEIQALLPKVDEVYLATDPDREGEAIAWHAKEYLKIKGAKRASFNEITDAAVKQAITEAGTLDMNNVNSALSRRIFDRVVGFQVSPLLWDFDVRSAGRCQSPALYFIVLREREILNFEPKIYFHVVGDYGFKATISEKKGKTWKHIDFDSEEKAKTVLEEIRSAQSAVDSVTTKEVLDRPKPPFTTSTLQQAASSMLYLKASVCDSLAQHLFEIGAVTYIRTDSVQMAPQAVKAARDYLKKVRPHLLSAKTNFYADKKGVQAGHECIRPTDFTKSENDYPDMKSEAKALYKLIRRRALASQAKPCKKNVTTLIVTSAEHFLMAKGTVILEQGWREVYQESWSEDKSDTIDKVYKAGDLLVLKEISVAERKTMPPVRYTEASLIKKLESSGIGRPSTFSSIVRILYDRDYIQQMKKGKQVFLQPADRGFTTIDLLEKGIPDILDETYTAQMEENLDEISSGKLKKNDYLSKWYDDFVGKVLSAKDKFSTLPKVEREKPKVELSEQNCPKCGQHKLKKLKDAMACSGYNRNDEKSCKFYLGKGEKILKLRCPECESGQLMQKKGPYGFYKRCLSCDVIVKNKKKMEYTGKKCPDCRDGDLVIRKGKSKKTKKDYSFTGCSRFPKCKFTLWED